MALLSRNYAITFYHGNQQMDFIRFEITPCMLKCNHFKPQNNFWSFSIVNWLVATSSIKRAASNTQKTQWIFYYLFDDATCMHVRTDSHVQQCFGFTIFGKVFFSSYGRHGGYERYRKKKLDYISALFLTA